MFFTQTCLLTVVFTSSIFQKTAVSKTIPASLNNSILTKLSFHPPSGTNALSDFLKSFLSYFSPFDE